MSALTSEPKKDHFWLYVALVAATAIGIIGAVKLAENDKYDPIRAQQSEEIARMNIRVLN